MFAQLDEMTDAPVTAEIVSGNRVRVAYGRSVVFSLDTGEAVDLVDAIATALAGLHGAVVQDEKNVGVTSIWTPVVREDEPW